MRVLRKPVLGHEVLGRLLELLTEKDLDLMRIPTPVFAGLERGDGDVARCFPAIVNDSMLAT
jgi:hypothetical protein